jgi:hypothetical protein
MLVEVGPGTRLGQVFTSALVETHQMHVYTGWQTQYQFMDGPDGSYPATGLGLCHAQALLSAYQKHVRSTCRTLEDLRVLGDEVERPTSLICLFILFN